MKVIFTIISVFFSVFNCYVSKEVFERFSMNPINTVVYTVAICLIYFVIYASKLNYKVRATIGDCPEIKALHYALVVIYVFMPLFLSKSIADMILQIVMAVIFEVVNIIIIKYLEKEAGTSEDQPAILSPKEGMRAGD